MKLVPHLRLVHQIDQRSAISYRVRIEGGKWNTADVMQKYLGADPNTQQEQREYVHLRVILSTPARENGR